MLRLISILAQSRSAVVTPGNQYEWSDVVLALAFVLAMLVAFFAVQAVWKWLMPRLERMRDYDGSAD